MAHLVQGFTYKKWWCSIAIHSYLQLPKDIISSSIGFSSDYILGCIGKYANFNAKLCWLCSELPLWQGFTQQNHTKSIHILVNSHNIIDFLLLTSHICIHLMVQKSSRFETNPRKSPLISAAKAMATNYKWVFLWDYTWTIHGVSTYTGWWFRPLWKICSSLGMMTFP